MGIKYKLHKDIGSITVAGKELTPDRDGIIDVPDDLAEHPEFHRLGKELDLKGHIAIHRPEAAKAGQGK